RPVERDAIVLRYFENKTLQEVGAALGVEERAAQKRVARSLERLRALLSKRGVVLTTALTAGVMSAHSVQAAPIGVAASVTAVAAKSAAASSSTAAIIQEVLKVMAWAKAKAMIPIGVAAVLAVGTSAVVIETKTDWFQGGPAWADDPANWSTDGYR